MSFKFGGKSLEDVPHSCWLLSAYNGKNIIAVKTAIEDLANITDIDLSAVISIVRELLQSKLRIVCAWWA